MTQIVKWTSCRMSYKHGYQKTYCYEASSKTKNDFHYFSPEQIGFTYGSKPDECAIVKIQNKRGKCTKCKANCHYKCVRCGGLCKKHALLHLD